MNKKQIYEKNIIYKITIIYNIYTWKQSDDGELLEYFNFNNHSSTDPFPCV